MTDISAIIAAYESATPDLNGECHTKVQLVEELGDALDDPTAFAFILRIASDADEHDLARIEAFKCLQRFSAPDKETHHSIGDVFADVIAHDDDVLIRQWAAQTAFPYMDVSSAFKSVTNALLDSETDIDVRYNCLHALKYCPRNENIAGVMTQLSTDATLGKSAQRVLKSYGVDPT